MSVSLNVRLSKHIHLFMHELITIYIYILMTFKTSYISINSHLESY